MVRQTACALALTLTKSISPQDPQRLQQIQLAFAAVEGALPAGDVLQAARLVGHKSFEAVYSRPSQAIYVLQGMQDAVRRLKFRAGLAFGAHWSDIIQVGGLDVPPHALSIARAVARRMRATDYAWVAVQGYGAWDDIAATALSLTCNVRYHRSMWQREAEAAYRATGDLRQVGARIAR